MYKFNSLLKVLAAYILAISFSIFYLIFYLDIEPIFRILYADIIATIIIYLFSCYYKNSSIYDPYWSVIPPLILVYFIYPSSITEIVSKINII